MFDATGSRDEETCPRCGSDATITYHYEEGFDELECSSCGYVSDAEELAALQRFDGQLLEAEEGQGTPLIRPRQRIKA